MTDTIVKLENVWIWRERHLALRDVSLDLRDNRFIGLMGPNGGGKTTLIKTIAGLIRPDRGTITVSGPVARTIGYVEDWKAGKRGFIQPDADGSTVQLHWGCEHAVTLLRQIAYAYAALGALPTDAIPIHSKLDHAGDFTFVDPARDWYRLPAGG